MLHSTVFSLFGCYTLPEGTPAPVVLPAVVPTAPADTASTQTPEPSFDMQPTPSALAAASASGTTPTETGFSKKDLHDTWGDDAVEIILNGTTVPPPSQPTVLLLQCRKFHTLPYTE